MASEEKKPEISTATLRLDEDDNRAVCQAVLMRMEWEMPGGTSNPLGAALAEICRGWMEFIQRSKADGRRFRGTTTKQSGESQQQGENTSGKETV